jgi:glycosyltransferase involved in cell wall biosynthesis
VKVVISVHGHLSRGAAASALRRDRFVRVLARLFYRRARGVVAVSAAVADDLVRVAGLRRDAVTVIHNPVVTPEAAAAAGELPAHPWFAEGEPPVLLAVGRLVPAKGFDVLVRSFAVLRRRRPARLLILGEGERRRELAGLVDELGLTADVAMPGHVDDPVAYMSRARLLALPSRTEGFGNVLVEAMMCGTPVVASDCPGGPREILRGGELGPLVPVEDVTALAVALEAVLDDPPDAAVLRRRANDFTLDAAVDAYLEVLT